MAHPAYIREKARELRIRRRLTIDELAARLALRRSRIYHWVGDLPIPGSGSGGEWPESVRSKGTRAMQRKYRRLREEAYQEGPDAYSELVAETTFRDFVCLYVAEGYKRNRNVVSICSSDPARIGLCHVWLRRLAGRPLEYAIAYHADQELGLLRQFWAGVLAIDPSVIKVQRKATAGSSRGACGGVATAC